MTGRRWPAGCELATGQRGGGSGVEEESPGAHVPGIDIGLVRRTRAHLTTAVHLAYPRPSQPRDVFGQESVHGQHQGRALRSEEHTSELQSLMRLTYAVRCLKK